MTNPTINPSEVGWQFVPQYYTFVNKQPNRLHCFYTKASTFIHGTEGEDGKPFYGQQEIHAKITSIGFQDCKVFIHSVDAQSSANGGIIIQVIGEMSNAGDAWKKFVQTFFLAEQPNGYFVLNDIFRFLKEEAVEDEPAEENELPVQEAPSQDSGPPSSSPAVPAAEVEPEPEPTPAPVVPAPVAEEPEVPPPSEPEPETQTNGVHEPEPTPAPVPEPPSQPQQETPATASPAPVSPAPVSKPITPAPAPAPASTTTPAQTASTPAPAAPPATLPPPAAPVPTGPLQPKTWANLAAAGRNKWGSAVADAKGVSEAPVSATSSAPPSTPHSPAPHGRGPPHQHAAGNRVDSALCYVKNVTESVSDSALRNVLTQRFGPIKDLDINRSKGSAFLEFQSVDSARRAITASLPSGAGGENGIRISEGGSESGNAPRVFVENRKERGDRPPTRGFSNGGDRGRGGFRGGRGGPGGGRGRGAPPQQK